MKHTAGSWTIGPNGVNGRVHHIGPIYGYDWGSLEIHNTSERGMGDAKLVSLAPTAPHDCEVQDCPGPVNKAKLDAAEGLLEAAKDLLSVITDSYTVRKAITAYEEAAK